MIVSETEAIYSAEAESALSRRHSHLQMPARREVMKVSEEELIEHCKKTLASYKASKSSDFLGHLPRNVMGKDFETDLRQKYWHGHAKRIQ